MTILKSPLTILIFIQLMETGGNGGHGQNVIIHVMEKREPKSEKESVITQHLRMGEIPVLAMKGNIRHVNLLNVL